MGHIFISPNEFEKINPEDMIAYIDFDGNKYCVTTQQVEENDIYVIDVDGVNYFKKCYKGNKKPFIIYIKSPFELRQERMRLRDDSEEKISKRLANDIKCFKGADNLADMITENNQNKSLNEIASKIYLEFTPKN